MWKGLTTSSFKPKLFVKASLDDASAQSIKVKNEIKAQVSGEEAKDFYEKLLLQIEPKNEINAQNNRILLSSTAKSVCTSDSQKRVVASEKYIFRAAERDDLDTFKSLFLSGQVDINKVDQFGWSLLMTSSCAGAENVTRFLLQNGADRSVRDKAGNSAENLAAKNNRRNILKLLENSGEIEKSIIDNNDSGQSVTDEIKFKKFYCKSCEKEIRNETQKVHKSSTLHQLKMGTSKVGTVYGISQTNKGFQMMLGKGWNKDKGLGPHGQGKQFPVKTVLKRDRTGIGLKGSNQARITHFKPNDPKSVENLRKQKRIEKITTFNKRKREKNVKRDKVKEQMFRLELNGI